MFRLMLQTTLEWRWHKVGARCSYGCTPHHSLSLDFLCKIYQWVSDLFCRSCLLVFIAATQHPGSSSPASLLTLFWRATPGLPQQCATLHPTQRMEYVLSLPWRKPEHHSRNVGGILSTFQIGIWELCILHASASWEASTLMWDHVEVSCPEEVDPSHVFPLLLQAELQQPGPLNS